MIPGKSAPADTARTLQNNDLTPFITEQNRRIETGKTGAKHKDIDFVISRQTVGCQPDT